MATKTNGIQGDLAEWEKEKARRKIVSPARARRTSGPPLIDSVTLITSSKYQPKYQLGKDGDIEVMVTLSAPVIVTGEPTLKIEFHPGHTRNAKYESGSSTEKLLFRYTVKEGDHSKGISVPGGKIIQVPKGSTIKCATTGVNLPLVGNSPFHLTSDLQVTDEFNENEVREVVDELSTDSRLATVVVEGENDTTIYNWIEKLLVSHAGSHLNIVPLRAGNRSNLLEIYNRRDEFSSRIPVAFLADLDYQVLADPTRMLRYYPDIIWTTGYSLENDLYTDANATNLIPDTDFNTYNAALKVVIDTFASDATIWDIGRIDPNLRKRYLAAITITPHLRLEEKIFLVY